MLTTPHAVTGATIAVLLPHPLLCVPVAIASHFVLDSVPHWQETLAPYTPTRKTYIRIPIDLALALVLVAFIARLQPEHVGLIWTGAISANVPDFDSLLALKPHLQRGWLGRFYDWHCAIQRETNSLWGLVPQIAVIALCLGVAALI